jgi:hypothetical protein
VENPLITLPISEQTMFKDAYPAATIIAALLGLVVLYWRGWSK